MRAPRPGRARFSEAKAREFISLVVDRYGARPEDFRPYRCPRCGCWHVLDKR